MIPRPLRFHEVSSCDYFVAGDVAKHYFQDGVTGTQSWTGSVASMITGWNGAGQAMRDPSSVDILVNESSKFDTWYVHARIRTPTLANKNLFALIDSGAGEVIRVRQAVTGVVAVGHAGGSTATALTMVANTWYSLEFCVRVVDAATGYWTLRADGVEVGSEVDLDTNGTGNPVLDLRFSGSGIDVDDIIVKRGYGGFTDDEFLNDSANTLRIGTMVPNDIGKHNVNWTYNGSGTGPEVWKAIDELPFDEGPFSGGNSARAEIANAVFSVKLDSSGLSLGADTVVHAVRMLTKCTTAAAATLRPILVNPYGGLAQHPSADIQPTIGSPDHRIFTRVWPGNFRAGVPWTGADMAALELGARLTSPPSTGGVNIAGACVEVVYTNTAAPVPVYHTEASASLLARYAHRFASCFRITRRDGAVLRFTESDRPLVVDGDTYSPLDGVVASATRAEVALKEQNRDFMGVLSSDAITEADLSAGRYAQAVVEEFLVDWRYPFAGKFQFRRYWIADVEWSGTFWQAQVVGVSRWLRTKIGRVFGKQCPYDFGGKGCTLPLEDLSYFAVAVDAVPSVATNRTVFRADAAHIPASPGPMVFGRLTWLTGDNWGLTSAVKVYTEGTREITLPVPLPFPVQVGDRFDVEQGCNKLYQTCLNVFANIENFGGFPWIPGTDKMLDTPQT